MRRNIVGLASALVAAAVLAANPFDTRSASAADQVATAVPEPAQQAPKDDYYTRRAKSVLAAEKDTAPKPHPLAAKYPGMAVVVCEAGCLEGSGAHVVSVRSDAELAAGRDARMVPMSATDLGPALEASDAPGTIACVAGCYGDTDLDLDAVPEPPDDSAARSVGTTSGPVAQHPERDKFSPIR